MVFQKLRPKLDAMSKKEGRRDEGLMNVRDLAKYMNVSQEYIYKLSSANQIPCIKRGEKFLRFRKDKIDKWLDSEHVPSTKPLLKSNNDSRQEKEPA